MSSTKPIYIHRFADITYRAAEQNRRSIVLGGKDVGKTINHPSALLPLVMMHAHQQAFQAGLNIDLGMEFFRVDDENETLFGATTRLREPGMTPAQMTLGGLMYTAALESMIKSLASVAKSDQRYARMIDQQGRMLQVDAIGLHAIMVGSYGKTYCLDELREKMDASRKARGSSASPEEVMEAFEQPSLMEGGPESGAQPRNNLFQV